MNRVSDKVLIALISVVSGLLPLGVNHFTAPVAAADAKIAEIGKQAIEAKATAIEAKTTADKAAADVAVLAWKVSEQTRTLDKTNDKLDGQAAQLNQLIGLLKGIGR
jgi:hypothetical protein